MKKTFVASRKGRRIPSLSELLRAYYLDPRTINPGKKCLDTNTIAKHYGRGKLTLKQIKHLYSCNSCFAEYMQLKEAMEMDVSKLPPVPESINKIINEKIEQFCGKGKTSGNEQNTTR